MFHSSKPLPKNKLSNGNFPEFYSLRLIFLIILLHLNTDHLFFNCLLSKNATAHLGLLTKLPKMIKIAIFLIIWFPNLLFRCGDIEANPAPKY